MSGIDPAPVTATPDVTFEWVAPAALLVDETYQRRLAEGSITLIRKIVGSWDWKRFKPPVVARSGEMFEVIDGQHTAIAAASHPGIDRIPVMIVDAVSREARANAFIGHNRDRLNMTRMQMHHAALIAGDDDALTLAQVCGRAGVTVLRSPPPNGIYAPGDTIAVVGIMALINRRGAMRAREVLEVLVKGHAAPVSAPAIRAVEMLLFEAEYKGNVEPSAIATALIALGPELQSEAKVFSVAHRVPLWRAYGVVLFRRASRGRRRAG
jgi:hypothetical protein